MSKPKAVNEKEVLKLLTDVLRRLDRLEERLGDSGVQGRPEDGYEAEMGEDLL